MDLDLKRVLAARPESVPGAPLIPLTTVWGEGLDAARVLAEHPRPLLARMGWQSLNGTWEYAIRESSDAAQLWDKARPPEVFDGTILVPFSPECVLSGVKRTLQPTQLLWYRRELTLAGLTDTSCYLLHFEGVDYACALYVNGVQVATHTCAYTPFDVDVTAYVRSGENEIALCVFDPTDEGTQMRGKQRLARANMWYTCQSGIWQSVWLEVLPKDHITSLSVSADADAATLTLEVGLTSAALALGAELRDREGALVACRSLACEDEGVTLTLEVPSPHLWSPDDPYLYDIVLTFGPDRVNSYCAFRSVGVKRDGTGVARLALNHTPIFLRGVLYQGYWPDGLLTAPSDEAILFDLTAVREAGFNCVRVHEKVESERFYYHCDRLGILVYQDMVSGGENPAEWPSVNIPTLFKASWARYSDTSSSHQRRLGSADPTYQRQWVTDAKEIVARLAPHPSIVLWCVFNESWGQFDSAKVTEALREIDATRPFVAASGWYDQGAGDVFAVHNYFRSLAVYPDPHAGRRKPSRAFLMDEFGGYTLSVAGHTSLDSVYGYDAYEDARSWREAYRRLIAEANALEEKGASGYVYTQLTDVEEETNGLLTYDRRVSKLREDNLP